MYSVEAFGVEYKEHSFVVIKCYDTFVFLTILFIYYYYLPF